MDPVVGSRVRRIKQTTTALGEAFAEMSSDRGSTPLASTINIQKMRKIGIYPSSAFSIQEVISPLKTYSKDIPSAALHEM